MIKTRIAAAGIVVGITASLMSASAAFAAPKGGFGCTLNPSLCEDAGDNGGGFGCTLNTKLCDGGVVVDPPHPQDPKCQIVFCSDDPPVLDPGTNDPQPTDPQPTQPDPEPSPTTPTTDPTPQPTTNPTQPTTSNDNNGQTGNVRPGRNTSGAAVQSEQVVQPIDASPVAATDQAAGYAPESQSTEQGLSSFAKLFISSILGGAAFGLLMWLKDRRKHNA